MIDHVPGAPPPHKPSITHRVIASPKTPLIALGGSVMAVAIAVTALWVGFNETNARSQFIRNSFCGFVQPVGLLTTGPNAPTTKTGQAIVQGASNTAHTLDCTVDPYDNK